jgi:hypothetical protein
MRDLGAKAFLPGFAAVKLRRALQQYRWANTPPEKRKFLRKQPTVAAKFYGQAVLQLRVLA